jgi:hypothetical protein
LDEQEIQAIYKMYPWARESTLEDVLRVAATRSLKLQQVARQLGQDIDPAKINDILKKSKLKDSKLKKSSDETTQIIRNMERDIDPLTATTELMSLGARALDGTVESVAKYTQFLGPIGAVVSKGASALSGGAVAATAVTGVFAKIINEQEKTVRAMIEYGAVVSDREFYTTLRGNLASIGMSMAELTTVLDGSKGMFATLTGDVMTGTEDFVKFAVDVESASDATQGDFGYNVEELTKRLGEEARMLYELGQIQSMDIVEKRLVKENFRKSSAMTTYLAEATGEQRSALLKMREEARSNIDFRQAMVQNGVYIAQTYGEAAEQNIIDANDNLAMILGATLGPDFAKQTGELLANTIRDIHLDTTSLNNASREIMDTLATLGPEVQQEYFNIIDQAVVGELAGEELVMRLQNLNNAIADATPREGDDPMVQRANALIAQARIAPQSFKDMTADQLAQGVSSAETVSENADSSIDAIDNARKAFRNTVHTLTPGFETSGAVLDIFTAAINGLGDTFAWVFGIETQNSEDKAQQEYERLLDLQDKARDLIEQRTGLIDRIKNSRVGYTTPAFKSQLENLEKTFDFNYLEQLANANIKISGGSFKDSVSVVNSSGVDITPKVSNMENRIYKSPTSKNSLFDVKIEDGRITKLAGQGSEQQILESFINQAQEDLMRYRNSYMNLFKKTQDGTATDYDKKAMSLDEEQIKGTRAELSAAHQYALDNNMQTDSILPKGNLLDELFNYSQTQSRIRVMTEEQKKASDSERADIQNQLEAMRQEELEIYKRINSMLESDNVKEIANGG